MKTKVRRIIAEHCEDGWLVMDLESGNVSLWSTADAAANMISKQDQKLIKANDAVVTEIEWRNVPSGFIPPKVS